jgi:GNAT superfamily N-acetyltransferase
VSQPDDLRITPATEAEVPVIHGLIRGLAEFERLEHLFTANERELRDALFGKAPVGEAVVASIGQQPVGYALWFYTYSTFLGKRGFYLEDLFVVPEARGKGVGRALLTHLARVAVERGCARIDWAVLNWNERAIRFYQSLGATPIDEWTIYRLTGDALSALARADE